MHLWQYEAQFGFCFRLDLTTLGQANMLRRKPIPGILAGSLALLKLLSSPIRNLLLTSPPWFTRIHTDTNIFAVLTVTDVYWHDVWHVRKWNNMETEDGPPHVAWWCSLPPAPPASPCHTSQLWKESIFFEDEWLERIGKDWKGLERWHTVKVPEPLKKFSCVLMCTGSSESPYSVHPSAIAAAIAAKVSIHRLLSTWSLCEE